MLQAFQAVEERVLAAGAGAKQRKRRRYLITRFGELRLVRWQTRAVEGYVQKRCRDLCTPQGWLVVVEFAWDRFDDATAMWCLDRLPPELDEDNWLHRPCGELHRWLREGRPLQAGDHFHQWAADEGVHSSPEILGALRSRFKERSFSWSPYLFPDLKGVTEGEEANAIETGAIQAVGFRFPDRGNG